jgi:hypothetical protein
MINMKCMSWKNSKKDESLSCGCKKKRNHKGKHECSRCGDKW